MPNVNLLEKGIYSVPDAARLTGVSQNRVRGWISGYPGTSVSALLDNEIGRFHEKLALSFVNLMEIRFIDVFSSYGVKVAAIRAMLEEAKLFLGHPHPFATNAIFRTDGRKIFASCAEATGDEKLYDLKAKNFAMKEIIDQSLTRGVEFDEEGNAKAWHPLSHDAPNVVIRPNWSFGQPHMNESGVPTRAIYDAYRVEDETTESVAFWFEIDPLQVHEAVRFETLLRAAA
ncbi:hypothetical protein [Minwuia sp.]|uniref:hypothetical protein n=1 Tax=Minwuia sp. TaxID=2493630 RepID=UPI003A92B02D